MHSLQRTMLPDQVIRVETRLGWTLWQGQKTNRCSSTASEQHEGPSRDKANRVLLKGKKKGKKKRCLGQGKRVVLKEHLGGGGGVQ